MLITLQHIENLYHVMTLNDYLGQLGLERISNNPFFQHSILCSETDTFEKFPIQKPPNFLYQKLYENNKKEEQTNQFEKRNDQNFQKKKYFIGSQKLLLSDDMELFYNLIGMQNFDYLVHNFKILIKDNFESETYIQIIGEPIMKMTQKQKLSTEEKISRQQILYCNHMSRQVGMFKKNFINTAKYQIIQSHLINEKLITKEIIGTKATSNLLDIFIKEKNYNQHELNQLRPILEKCMLKLQKYCFHKAFKIFVPLPNDYLALKKEVRQVQKLPHHHASDVLDKLYGNFVQFEQIISLVRNFLGEIIPSELFGKQNFYTFLKNIEDFITFLRFEDQSYLDYIKRMNVFEIPWLSQYFNKKKQKILISQKRIKLIPILKFLFQQILIPFLRHNFYITDRMKDDWKLFYYRNEIWHLVLKLTINQLTQSNFEEVQVNSLKTEHVGKLRIVPKPGTFRPIITYNRKSKTSRISLNKKLQDIKYILRNFRNQQLGFSVFGNPQIFRKLEEFKALWIKLQHPKIYFVTMDISKCYDSIILEHLLKFIEESNLFSSAYAINRYNMILRTNKQLKQSQTMSNLFNIYDKACALPITKMQLIQKGYMEFIQKQKQTIIINQGFQNIVTFDEFLSNIKNICTNNIVQFEKRFFRQTLGIPQGLNISGILCSFYLANIEKKLTNKILSETLIMRLTDDYCCLTFSKDNLNQILNNFKVIEKEYKICLNHDKTQLNINTPQKMFKWIGKIIDIEKFTIKPAFYLDDDSKFQFQINVNLPTQVKTFYLKSKLKSLILNQFKFFFNCNLNDHSTMMKIVKIFIHTGLIKLIPYLKRIKLQNNNPKINNKLNFLKILRQIKSEIASYCVQQHEERNQVLDHYYIARIIQRQIRKTVKGNELLKKIINYKKI